MTKKHFYTFNFITNGRICVAKSDSTNPPVIHMLESITQFLVVINFNGHRRSPNRLIKAAGK